MPVYNGERYLAAAIASVLEQEFSDFELIVIDDGSEDGTADIIGSFADERMRCVCNPTNAGVVFSLNTGLKLARGEYVARMDADDIALPQRFAQQVAHLDSHPQVGVVGTEFLAIDEHDKPASTSHPALPTENACVKRQLLESNCICHGSVMMRRICVEKVCHYSQRYPHAEDYDLWLRMIEVTEIENLNSVLFLQRQHAESVSRKHHRHQIASKARLLEDAASRRQGTDHLQPRREVIAQFYLQAAIANHVAGESVEAQICLQRALAAYPTLFTDVKLAATAFSPYEPDVPQEAVDFADEVFAKLLPSGAQWSALQRRLAGQLYMRAIFGALADDDWDRVDRYLWPALRRNPAWLLNRGVLITLFRGLLLRMGHRPQRRRSGPKEAQR